MVKRYKPEWKKTGTKQWQSFPNKYSFGLKKLAEKFINQTRKKYKKVGRKGAFRLRVEKIKI